MTAQPSTDSTALETENSGIAMSPEEAVELLGRFDAVLDELYALRQVVLQWTTSAPTDDANHVGDENVIREAVKELTVGPPQTAVTADDKQASAKPVTDALVAAAAKAAWAKVYTNAEIAEMRRRGEVVPSDLVSQLSGSLGPARPEDRDDISSFDFVWGRFSE